MVRATPLALAGLLSACSGGDETERPPAPPDCVDWWLDADQDGFGDDGAEPARLCDGSVPEGYVQNAEDCDDLDPDVNPLADELCDLLGRDENCNGLVDDDDPAVIDTVATYPDDDGDGFGVAGPTEQACPNASGRSRNTGDCDDSDPSVFPGAGEFEGDDTLCTQDADRDGFASSNPDNPVAAPGTDCDDGDDAIFPGAPDPFGDGIDQDCNGREAIVDDFEGGPDPAVWDLVRGDAMPSGLYARSGTTSLNLGGGGALAVTIPFDMSSCATAIDWSFWVKRGDEPPDSYESLIFEVSAAGGWRMVALVPGTSITDASFAPYLGAVTDPALFAPDVRFRWSTFGSGVGFDDYFIDDVEINCL